MVCLRSRKRTDVIAKAFMGCITSQEALDLADSLVLLARLARDQQRPFRMPLRPDISSLMFCDMDSMPSIRDVPAELEIVPY